MKKAMKRAVVMMILSGLLLAVGCGKKAAGTSTDGETAAMSGWSSITESNAETEADVKTETKADKTTTADIETKTATGTQAEAETSTETKQEYEQYLKKTWIRKEDKSFPENGGVSIAISQISGGVLKGSIDAVSGGPAYNMDTADLEGKVSQNTADCQLVNDSRENSGTVKIIFGSDKMLEAEIAITKRSQDTIMSLPVGKFEFVPYTLDMVKGFEKIKEQSFPVTLNQWGDVQFVSGKLTSGDHVPDVFYLTDQDGDILYNFNVTLPYQMDVRAVAFPDINKDGLKDLIIIVSDSEDQAGASVAAICLQNKDGSFTDHTELDQKINNSGHNSDVKSILKYLADNN